MSRIQDERSAETRKRLLDATVDCLFERGYAGTTTAEIASRAGFSKGAQLHHFPTKEKLVISALEYLFELRLAASSDPVAIAKLPKFFMRGWSSLLRVGPTWLCAVPFGKSARTTQSEFSKSGKNCLDRRATRHQHFGCSIESSMANLQ